MKCYHSLNKWAISNRLEINIHKSISFSSTIQPIRSSIPSLKPYKIHLRYKYSVVYLTKPLSLYYHVSYSQGILNQINGLINQHCRTFPTHVKKSMYSCLFLSSQRILSLVGALKLCTIEKKVFHKRK